MYKTLITYLNNFLTFHDALKEKENGKAIICFLSRKSNNSLIFASSTIDFDVSKRKRTL